MAAARIMGRRTLRAQIEFLQGLVEVGQLAVGYLEQMGNDGSSSTATSSASPDQPDGKPAASPDLLTTGMDSPSIQVPGNVQRFASRRSSGSRPGDGGLQPD
jgi:hypothetical protein